jgi:4-aminobutyrate aminotransferase-like enzyme
MLTSQYAGKQQKFLYPSVKTYYPEPLVLALGNGRRVKDVNGEEYLDCFGGILTTSVGHARPEVVEAMCDQVRRIVHTSTCYLNVPILELAEKLAAITPGSLQKSFFTNSGTEAIETAIASARFFTKSPWIVSLRHGYHGRSVLASSVTGHAAWRLPTTEAGITQAHNGYCYRCPFHQTYPGCDMACARDIEELIKTTTDGHIAALIAEPIQGVGGFITPPPEYFKIATEIVKRFGGLFICDEVQTGFGRTGDFMFGIEHWGVEPDLMVFAKGLANGAAIGATIARPEIADAWSTSTISTFGGNPISMAAALATLKVMEKEDIPAHVSKMGKAMFAGLRQLQEKYPFMGDVRGKGLMIGIETVREGKVPAPDLATAFLDAARLEGVLVGKGGLYGNVLRVTPPMTITADEVAEALERLGKACARVAAVKQ